MGYDYKYIDIEFDNKNFYKHLEYMYEFIDYMSLDGDYIFWNKNMIIELAETQKEYFWLLFIVFSNTKRLKNYNMKYYNFLARYLYYNIIQLEQTHTQNVIYIFINKVLKNVVKSSQIGIFSPIESYACSKDQKYCLGLEYDLKKGNLVQFLVENEQIPKYPYIKAINLKKNELNDIELFYVKKLFGFEMIFTNPKDRYLLLDQIKNHYKDIYQEDDEIAFGMLIEDLNAVLNNLSIKINILSNKFVEKRMPKKFFDKAKKITQKCISDIESDIKWLKEIKELIPGGKKYMTILKRQKKIKENPTEALKIYKKTFKK